MTRNREPGSVPDTSHQRPPIIHIGPRDHGRAMILDDYERASTALGYRYELIDGHVEIFETPECPHAEIDAWFLHQLLQYEQTHRGNFDRVRWKSAVYPIDRDQPSCLLPDIALFHELPDHSSRRITWREMQPLLVVEVTSPECPEKDLVRNVPLYLAVPSIREYWIVDQRPDPDYPSLTVYRRRGAKWQKPIAVAPGQTYTTRLLPGFELKLDAPAS